METIGPPNPLLLSSVSFGPLPRRTLPLAMTSVAEIAKVPAESETTCSSGHESRAAWIGAVASRAPSPYVEASREAQTVPRAGIPPGIPGFHAVARSAGIEYVPAGCAGVDPPPEVQAATAAAATMPASRYGTSFIAKACSHSRRGSHGVQRGGRPFAIQAAKYRLYRADPCQSTETSFVDQLSLSVYRPSSGVRPSRSIAGSPQ